jgi:ATP-binding cassette, subfamily B, bacterial PglK
MTSGYGGRSIRRSWPRTSRRLPGGLDAVLGEHGARLSAGQRQRVGIARALYRDPDLLVLDEATSTLDAATENEVASAIAALKGRKTLVVIAHRQATLQVCDRLVLLGEGKIEAIGQPSVIDFEPAKVATLPVHARLSKPSLGTSPAKVRP